MVSFSMQSAIALQYRRIQGQLLHMTVQVRALAAELGLESDGMDAALLHRWLEAPLHVLACGEARVGKSTLLRRLFDCALTEAEPGMERKQVLVYQHHFEPAEMAQSAAVRQIALADVASQGWRLVEAADAHCRDSAYLEVLHREWHDCDVAFFCLSAHQPFAAAAWDLLGQQSHLVLDHVILVLQQADQRVEGDIPLLLQHVRDLAFQRLGRVLPVVAIGLPAGGQERGLQELRLMVSQRIEGSVNRRRGIRAIFAALGDALSRIETRLNDMRHEHDSEMHEINRLQQQMELHAWSHWQECMAQMGSLMEALLPMSEHWQRRLERRITWQATLHAAFFGENQAKLLGLECLDDVREALVSGVKRDQAAWTQAAFDLFQALHKQLPDDVRGLIVLKSVQRLELMKQSEAGAQMWLQEAQAGLHRLGLRITLDSKLQLRVQRLRPWLVLLLAAAHGLTLSFLVSDALWLSGVFFLFVLSFFVMFLRQAQESKQQLVEELTKVMQSRLMQEISSHRDGYGRWLMRHYGDSAYRWDPLRSILRQRFSGLRPSTQRVEELQLSLRMLEHEWE